MGLMGKLQNCELCRKQATLYCEPDLAYLCGECDRKVHGANFLVARHTRNMLCCRCNRFTEICVRGACPALLVQSLCGSCSALPEQTSLCISSAESVIPGPVSSDSSSPGRSDEEYGESRREIKAVGVDCGPVNGLHVEGQKQIVANGEEEDGKLQICCREEGLSDSPVSEVSIDGWSYSKEGTSSLASQKILKKLPETGHGIPKEDPDLSNKRQEGVMQNAEMKVETILTKWYRHLNLRSPSTVPLAMHLMEKALCKLGSSPNANKQKVRISLAASLWLAATLCENQAQLPPVKRVQDCTGIPSKLILWAGSRLFKLLNWKIQKEGWAECST